MTAPRTRKPRGYLARVRREREADAFRKGVAHAGALVVPMVQARMTRQALVALGAVAAVSFALGFTLGLGAP